MAEGYHERVVRMLGIVAYVERNPGVSVEEIAEHFGVSRAQVLKDVDTLWVSGTPGYWPDDLIDFDAGALEAGRLRLTSDRGVARPLRLGTREAVVLLAALRALEETAGTALDEDERAVLTSTVDALRAVTGDAAQAVDVHLSVEADADVVRTARSAARAGHQVRLRYVDAADVVTERVVDPWQVLTGDEGSYLHAWWPDGAGERMFRLDRVLAITELDTPLTRAPRPRDDVGFRPDAGHERVSLELDGPARWVAEQMPVEEVADLPDGGLRVTLRVASPAWLRHLVLRLAPFVRSVEPVTVVDDVVAAARAALARYDAR